MGRAKLNEHGVTEQQEKFCHAFVETGNASESYRRGYKTENMNDNSIARKAHDVLHNVNVTARIAALRETHTKRHGITVDTLLEKLNRVYEVAMDTGTGDTPRPAQAAAATGAVMAQAKLLGLDKQLIELSGEIGVRKTLDDFYGDA